MDSIYTLNKNNFDRSFDNKFRAYLENFLTSLKL